MNKFITTLSLVLAAAILHPPEKIELEVFTPGSVPLNLYKVHLSTLVEEDIYQLMLKKVKKLETSEGREFVGGGENEEKMEYALYTDQKGDAFFFLMRDISAGVAVDSYYGLVESDEGFWLVRPSNKAIGEEGVSFIHGVSHETRPLHLCNKPQVIYDSLMELKDIRF